MAEDVLNARELYGEILAQGYPGKESKVHEFVHIGVQTRKRWVRSALKRLLESRGKSIGAPSGSSRTYRLYAFVMTLGWSQASYVRLTISSDTTWFIQCHLHAFAY